MATKIRLKRLGKIRSPHYRIIVIDERAHRNGKAIEEVGIYHPKTDPSIIQVNSERIQYWLSVGAQPTEAVVAILKRSGDWQKHTGDDSIPSGIDVKDEKKSKLDLFNAALAEEDDAPKTSAITTKAKKDDEETPSADEVEKAADAETADEAEAADAEAKEEA